MSVKRIAQLAAVASGIALITQAQPVLAICWAYVPWPTLDYESCQDGWDWADFKGQNMGSNASSYFYKVSIRMIGVPPDSYSASAVPLTANGTMLHDCRATDQVGGDWSWTVRNCSVPKSTPAVELRVLVD